MYAVKKIERAGDDVLVTLTDTHGIEYEPLDLKSIRKHVFCISIKREHSPDWSTRSTIASIFLLLGLAGIRGVANKTNRALDPNYRNFINEKTKMLLTKIR